MNRYLMRIARRRPRLVKLRGKRSCVQDFAREGKGIMSGLHNLVGSLVVLTFLAGFGANLYVFLGRSFAWRQYISIIAATLLLLQYLIGFSLLADDRDNSGWHYVFAFLPLLTVGLEHGYARTRPTPREQALWGMIATGGTFVLVLIAFIIGQSNS
jgi:hypothetical protein